MCIRDRYEYDTARTIIVRDEGIEKVRSTAAGKYYPQNARIRDRTRKGNRSQKRTKGVHNNFVTERMTEESTSEVCIPEIEIRSTHIVGSQMKKKKRETGKR